MIADLNLSIVLSQYGFQFKYCPILGCFATKGPLTELINYNERALGLAYDDNLTSFLDLLAKDGLLTVHHTGIQTLLFEMYKTKHNLSKSCLKDIFSAANGNYNLHCQCDYGVPGINTGFYSVN